MASYYNYLKDGQNKPMKAVKVRLYKTSTQTLVTTTVTDDFGFYSFTDVPNGTYDIHFYGNNLTQSDWLYNVQILEADNLTTSGLKGDPGQDGLNAIYLHIVPTGSGVAFVNDAPDELTFKADLYVGGEVDNNYADVIFTWKIGDTLLKTGTAGNNSNTDNLFTFPRVSGTQNTNILEARAIVVQASPYILYGDVTDKETIYNIRDGVDGDKGEPGDAYGLFRAELYTTSGTVFSSSAGVYGTRASVKLFSGETEVTSNLSYVWKIDNIDQGLDQNFIDLNTDNILARALVSCDVTYTTSGITRHVEDNFVDFTDPFSIFDINPVIGHISWGIEPTIIVEELRDHYGFSPIGRGQLTISGLQVKAGVIKTLALDYKNSSNRNFTYSVNGSNIEADDGSEESWKQIAQYSVNYVSGLTYFDKFDFSGVPITDIDTTTSNLDKYDFRLRVFNANGEQGTVEYLTIPSSQIVNVSSTWYTNVSDVYFYNLGARIEIIGGSDSSNRLKTPSAIVGSDAFWTGNTETGYTSGKFWVGNNDALYSFDKIFIGQDIVRITVPELALSDDGGNTWITMSPDNSGYGVKALKSNKVLIRFLDLRTRTANYPTASGITGNDKLQYWEGDYVNDPNWPDSPTLSELTLNSHFKKIKRYAVLAFIYNDKNQTLHKLASGPGLNFEGPGGYGTAYTLIDGTFRVLKIIEADQVYNRTTNGSYITSSVILPPGRMLTLYVYMLVDNSPMVYDSSSNKPLKYDISDEDFPGD